MNDCQFARLGVVITVAILLITTGASTALAQGSTIDAQGSPDIELYTPNNQVTPGTETEFTIQFSNDGEFTDGNERDREYVTTARSVVTSIDAEDSPIIVKTGEKSVGNIPESNPKSVPFDIEVPDDAATGTYEIEVDFEYTYTSKARSGVPNENNIQTTQSRSRTEDVKIKITDDARFRVTDINSTLRVGEEGDITGEIQNIGGEDATNAEVQFPTEAENLFPQETAVAVGDIEAGESAEFRIPIEVGSEAEAVPKRFDLPVSFRDENGIRQTDDDPSFLADIAAERDAFTIEAADRSITAGSSTTVDFTITNNRDETVTDIEPKLFADTPLSSSNDEAFVQSLDAGESTTISFDLAASATTPKTYPVTVDIRYRDAGGDSQITDSYRLPIDVSQAEEGGLLGSFGTIIVSIISLLTVGGGYVWYRNQ
jgi:hypothetical protein